MNSTALLTISSNSIKPLIFLTSFSYFSSIFEQDPLNALMLAANFFWCYLAGLTQRSSSSMISSGKKLTCLPVSLSVRMPNTLVMIWELSPKRDMT